MQQQREQILILARWLKSYVSPEPVERVENCIRLFRFRNATRETPSFFHK